MTVSGYKSLAHVMQVLANIGGSSRHRTARVQRFVFRHPKAHNGIVRQLVKKQQEHEAACDRRFLEARRNALSVYNAERR